MNPESASRRTTHDIEAIADCARLITQIITDNRETINLIFKDINEMLKEDKETPSNIDFPQYEKFV